MLFGAEGVGKPTSAAWTMRSRPTLQVGPVAGLLEPAKKSKNAGKMAVPDEASDPPDETRPIRWLHRLHILSFWRAAQHAEVWHGMPLKFRGAARPHRTSSPAPSCQTSDRIESTRPITVTFYLANEPFYAKRPTTRTSTLYRRCSSCLAVRTSSSSWVSRGAHTRGLREARHAA